MKKIFLVATMSLLTAGITAKSLEFNNPLTVVTVANETITAQFSGYDADLGSYDFTYLDEYNEELSISFSKISADALASFDLKSDSFTGKTFKIIYDTKTIDEEADGESYEVEVNNIISLELE